MRNRIIIKNRTNHSLKYLRSVIAPCVAELNRTEKFAPRTIRVTVTYGFYSGLAHINWVHRAGMIEYPSWNITVRVPHDSISSAALAKIFIHEMGHFIIGKRRGKWHHKGRTIEPLYADWITKRFTTGTGHKIRWPKEGT